MVYANTNQAILIVGSLAQITNNTVYQSAGDAVRIEGGSRPSIATLRNNILWTDAGDAISVANDGQAGFDSDYNTLYTTGTGKLARWSGRDFTSLADWFYEVGFDGHSRTGDPLLIDPNGADELPGTAKRH